MTDLYKMTTVSAPAVEPVNLDEVKSFLRITHNQEDSVLNGYIKAARMFCENYTGKSFINRSLLARYERLENPERIVLPRGPIVSVENVKTYGTDETVTDLSDDAYALDVVAGSLKIASSSSLICQKGGHKILDVTYTAGYGETADDVPEPIRQAILMKATQMYEGRGDVPLSMPFDMIASLLKPYKKIGVIS